MPDPWSVAYRHRKLGYTLAAKFLGLGVDRGDLEQEGLIGLHRAALEFDASLGVPYSAYARYHVLHAMRTAVYRGGRGVRRTRRGWVPRDPGDAIAPEPEARDGSPAIDHDERERLLSAIDALPDAWRRVIRDRYLAVPARLQREIAADLGVTTVRVSQLERKALDRLAQALSSTGMP